MRNLRKIRRMNHLKRCQLYPVLHSTSVAEHSFHVTIMALYVAEELKVLSIDVDELKVLRTALTHDIEEIVTTDIPHPVKQYIQSTLDDYIEKQFLSDYKGKLPQWLEDAILIPTNGCLEHRIVKACDMAELILYCVDEEDLGNSQVSSMKKRAQEVLSQYTGVLTPCLISILAL